MADIINFTTSGGEGKKSEQQSEFSQTLRDMLGNTAELIEFHKVRAEIKRQHYLHLVKEGFTEEEAMDIVKSDPSI